MSTPILPTKLYIPTPRPGMVARPNLIQKLEGGQASKLVLISAPAGYGKTTLLAEWVNQKAIPVCWVSLDAQDNDLRRFFSYLIASLKCINILINENTLANLIDQRPETISDFLSHLIHQIAASSQPAYLVLDDYHRITNPEIHQAIIHLLENLPPELHLVIATRSDPMLRLAKLRAQGDLLEIRVDDLRFTIAESVQYLNERMRLGLTKADISSLLQKTEGWIVGLQLAGISLQQHPDKHQFVLSFAGNDRYIADYLFDEAVNRQPDHIQSFLLHTAILERFNPPLCNAITQRDDSQAILVELDRANLFLVPLDSQRNWYRYHHLFGDLLLNRLHQTIPEKVTVLHAQASIWFEENNLLADSITHAVAANLIDRVVSLTEDMAVHKMYAGELSTLITWLEQQPEDIYRQYPWLLATRSWAFMNTGRFDAVLPSLAELENILSSESYSPALKNRIQGHSAAIRAYYWELMGNDTDSEIREAENAYHLLTDEDIHLRSFVAIRWANGLAWIGNYPKAIQVLKEAGNASKIAGDGQLAVNAFSEMAVLQLITGQLKQANEDIIETKDYAEMLAKKDGRRPPSMGVLYRHLSNIKYERNELSVAEFYARQAVESCQQHGEQEALYIAYIVLAKVHHGRQEYGKFDPVFDQGLQIVQQIFPNGLVNGTNIRNHFYLLQGRIEKPEIWVRERGLKSDDQIEYTGRLEYQNFARLLIAQGNFPQALQVINNVLRAIEKVGAKGHWLKTKIIQAKILHWLNRPKEALIALEKTLVIASQEGYVRSYLDEGEVIAQLLYQSSQRGIYPHYCKHLLDGFADDSVALQNRIIKTDEMIEPLSHRELEVLTQIALGRSNQEIAQELIVSLSTIKTHARHIFGKLGVKNRTEAVAKARLYGLLVED